MVDVLVTATDAAGNQTTRTVSLAVESTTPPLRVNNCSVWAMMWSNSPKTDIANLAPAVDEVRLAFVINNGVLSGYGPYGGKANLTSALKAFLAKRSGRFITWSIGGGGQSIDVSNPTGFVANLAAIERDLGVTFGGLNWDWESGAFASNASRVLEISRQLRAARGKDFYISWSPNGVYKNDYRSVLTGHADLVDEISQQYYDSVITYDQALTETRKYVDLFGADKVGTGCAMPGSSGTGAAWTLPVWSTNVARLRADAGVRKTNFWEGANSSTTAWATAMKAVTG